MIAFSVFIMYNTQELSIRMWLSLVERLLWEQDAAGSNPVIRTKSPESAQTDSGLFCLYRSIVQAVSCEQHLLLETIQKMCYNQFTYFLCRRITGYGRNTQKYDGHRI